jgi:hypothetical protein
MESSDQGRHCSGSYRLARRAFILFGGLLAGTLAGGWLGLVAAFVSGIATSEPPRFPEKTSWRQSSSAGCWPSYSALQ